MEDASQNGVNGNRCDVADIPIYSWPGAETDAEAARVAALAYKPGISSMCVRQRYDDLSLDYDNVNAPISYSVYSWFRLLYRRTISTVLVNKSR